MIPVIISWFYIVFILFATGLLFATVTDHISVVLIKGVVVCTVLGCLLSLFIPLSLVAGIITLALAVAFIILFRKKATLLLQKCRNDIKSTSWALILLLTAYALVVAFLSTNEPSHYDEGLYYGTTIKWLEEEGVIKGLVNLNPRIAFNSTWHVLQALFSFHYIGNFNDLNGLLVLIMMMYCLGGLTRVMKRDYRLSVIVRSLLFLPIAGFHFGATDDFWLFNINYLSSPTADLPVCLLLWMVFTWLIELAELPEERRPHHVLLVIVVAVLLFTIKPSAAPVLLICVYFFVNYIFQKRFWQAGGLVLLASFILIPWVIRNIIISGYLFFPFSSVDIIPADWKLPIQHVKWFENAVKVYSINPEYDLNKPFIVPIREWFGGWFGRLSFIQSLLFISGILSCLLFAVLFIAGTLRSGKKFVYAQRYVILCTITAVLGSLFWFLKGPDFRLGYGFVAILTILSLAMMLRYFLVQDVKYAGYVFIVGFYSILYFHYKTPQKELAGRLTKSLPERRLPASMKTVTTDNGITIYLVNYGDSWYGPLPICNETEYYTVFPVPRGASVKDGFKASGK